MKHIKHYTRVAKVLNNAIPLIKKIYIEHADEIKNKFENDEKKQKIVSDALTKLKNAKTKCAVVSFIGIISTYLKLFFDTKASKTKEQSTPKPVSAPSQSKPPQSEPSHSPPAQGAGENIEDDIELVKTVSLNANQPISTDSDAIDQSTQQALVQGGSGISGTSSAPRLEDETKNQSDGDYNSDWNHIDSDYGSFNDNTCLAYEYVDLVGWIDSANLGCIETNYENVQNTVNNIASNGVEPQRAEGGTNSLQLVAGIAYWIVGATMVSVGGPVVLGLGTATAMAGVQVATNALTGAQQ